MGQKISRCLLLMKKVQSKLGWQTGSLIQKVD